MRENTWGRAVLSLVVLSTFGCLTPKSSIRSLPEPARAEDSTSLTYITQSDRLNIASSPFATVSQGGAALGQLPGATTSRLTVVHPHPVLGASMAMAELTAQISEDGEPIESETRRLDVPAWQVEAVMKRLDEERFFRRSKPLSADAKLRVVRQGAAFEKPFRSIAELDALMIRVRRDGQRPSAVAFTRLPPLTTGG